MDFLIEGIGSLVMALAIWAILAYLRRPKKGKDGVVSLSNLLFVVGIVGILFFLGMIIAMAITLEREEALVAAAVLGAFSLVGVVLIVAWLNCKIFYDEDGFTVKSFWGTKKRYCYQDVTGIKGLEEVNNGLPRDICLYVGKKKVKIDGASVGREAFIAFVQEQYRLCHNGAELPNVSGKSR